MEEERKKEILAQNQDFHVLRNSYKEQMRVQITPLKKFHQRIYFIGFREEVGGGAERAEGENYLPYTP